MSIMQYMQTLTTMKLRSQFLVLSPFEDKLNHATGCLHPSRAGNRSMQMYDSNKRSAVCQWVHVPLVGNPRLSGGGRCEVRQVMLAGRDFGFTDTWLMPRDAVRQLRAQGPD